MTARNLDWLRWKTSLRMSAWNWQGWNQNCCWRWTGHKNWRWPCWCTVCWETVEIRICLFQRLGRSLRRAGRILDMIWMWLVSEWLSAFWGLRLCTEGKYVRVREVIAYVCLREGFVGIADCDQTVLVKFTRHLGFFNLLFLCVDPSYEKVVFLVSLDWQSSRSALLSLGDCWLRPIRLTFPLHWKLLHRFRDKW